MPDLKGRTAIVTGASSGIGRAIARALVDAGADVLATGRSERELAATAASHPRIRTIAGDLTEPGFVDRLMGVAGTPDILINNAGRLRHAPFLESRLADWRAVFELNVLATLVLAQAAAAVMARRGSGHIVLISSLLARRVTPYTMIYAASKHAVAAIAAGLRLELETKGIRVTEIAPGLVATNAMKAVDDAEVLATYAAHRNRFDWLQPEDVAASVLSAVATRPGACPDLIELRPVGQG